MDHKSDLGKSNKKQETKTDEPNRQKNTEGEKEKLKLFRIEEKHLVGRQNLKQLKEYYGKQKKRIEEIKEKIKIFEHRDKGYINTFSGVCQYDNYLRTKIGDNIKKRTNILGESLESVRTMFYEIEYSPKLNAEGIKELSERIQAQENVMFRMNEYIDNFTKTLEHTKIITKQQMDSAKRQKSILNKTLEKILTNVKNKKEVQLQLEKELSETERTFQNIPLEKHKSLMQELTLIESNLKSQMERIETELNTFKLDSEELSNDLNLLTCSLTEKNTNINALNILVTEKDHKLKIVNAKIAELHTNHEKKEEELQSLKQTLFNRKTMTRQFASKLESLMQTNSKNCSEVRKLKAILQSKKEKLSSLSEEVNNQKDLVTRQSRQYELLKARLKQFEQHNFSMCSQLNDKTNLRKFKENQIKELQSKVQHLKLKNQAAREENKNLKEEKVKVETEKEQKMNILQQEVSNLKSILLKGDQVIQEMITEKKDLEKENKQIHSNFSQVEQNMRLVEKLNNELKHKVIAGKEEMKKFNNELSQCKENLKHSCPEKTETSTDTVVSQKKQLLKITEDNKYPNIDSLLYSQILLPTTASMSSYQNFVERNTSNLSDEDFAIQHLFSDPNFFSKLNRKDLMDGNTLELVNEALDI